MTDIDDVLEQSLTDVLTGASTLDECLARHPEYAEQLEPLLRTASRVEMGSRVLPAPAFRSRTRAKLTLHMQAHPRRQIRATSPFFWRMVTGLAALVLTLFVTGTVYAQGVLPGDPFYDWKLTSEHAWRLVSSDVAKTDLRIANRRINEMNVTVSDQAKWAKALEGYREVRSRLKSEIDAETLNNILPPAELFTYPGMETATPVPALQPNETAAPNSKDKDKDKDKDPKDKDGQQQQDPKDGNNGAEKNKDEQESGRNKDKGSEDTIPSSVDPTPKIIPTIVIPPPID